MFIAVLFIIAKTWKQPKCPSTDEWIKKMLHTHVHIHTHTVKYYLAIKKEWNIAIYSNMDGPRDYDTEWSKSGRERQILYHLYVESNTNEFIYKTETDSQT